MVHLETESPIATPRQTKISSDKALHKKWNSAAPQPATQATVTSRCPGASAPGFMLSPASQANKVVEFDFLCKASDKKRRVRLPRLDKLKFVGHSKIYHVAGAPDIRRN